MSIASPARVSPLDSELLRQWLAVPEHLTAEIVGGELVTMPRPPPKHALAQDELLIEPTRVIPVALHSLPRTNRAGTLLLGGSRRAVCVFPPPGAEKSSALMAVGGPHCVAN
jgi:hypothetical protein